MWGFVVEATDVSDTETRKDVRCPYCGRVNEDIPGGAKWWECEGCRELCRVTEIPTRADN